MLRSVYFNGDCLVLHDDGRSYYVPRPRADVGSVRSLTGAHAKRQRRAATGRFIPQQEAGRGQ